jgi:transposase-like protein
LIIEKNVKRYGILCVDLLNLCRWAGSAWIKNMLCPKCDSENTVKNGLPRGVQRYKCKNCNSIYTGNYSQYQQKERKQRLVLILYLEGLHLQAIGKVLNVTPVTVYNWVRSYGKEIIDKIRNPRPVQMVEWKEMRYYGNSQKTMEGFGVVLIV